MERIGDRAVVLGGGFAGLLAARVLAGGYETVSMVDRDSLAEAGTAARRGVPQGRHAHSLLPRGQEALEELLPDIRHDLVAAGAILARPGRDYRFVFSGHELTPFNSDDDAVQCSRPLLEGITRARVVALPGVSDPVVADAVGLCVAGGRVTGVQVVRRKPGSAVEVLPADVVVDATGRASRVPLWLSDAGYVPAPTTSVAVNVWYASRTIRPRTEDLPKALIVGPRPGLSAGMGLAQIENGQYVLTVAGVAGHRPPGNQAGFDAFAASVAPPDLAEALRDAKPTSEITRYHYVADRRTHYERARRMPGGLVVIGDALCSFNPIYGQGMTVAALEALALAEALQTGLDQLGWRYHTAAAKALSRAWRLAVDANLAMPEVGGRRTLATRVRNAYATRVQASAEHDPAVAEQFLRVVGLLDPPSALARPSVLGRVLTPLRMLAAVPTTKRPSAIQERKP